VSDEERYDAFGRPIGGSDEEEKTAAETGGFLPPSEAAPPAPAPDAPASQPQFLPPTEQPPEREAWWAEPAPPGPAAPGTGAPAAATDAADYMNRVGAAVLDFLVRLGIVIPGLIVGAIAGGGGETGIWIGGGIAYLVALAYAPWMIATRNGQTIGHRVTNTRIVRTDGGPVSGGMAFVREILVKLILFENILGTFTFFIGTLLNYLWPLWDDRNEALHDKMCNTRVVNA
jgi:uncharacterized RDD family membrane protein YckC